MIEPTSQEATKKGCLCYPTEASCDDEGFFLHVDCPLHEWSMKPPGRPRIVCLCGSTRFMGAFLQANREESLKGNIVLTVSVRSFDANTDPQKPSPEQKEFLDELHKRKIDLADEILVLNCGSYIGESTRSEIAYAERLGRPIRYLEPLVETLE